MEATMEKIEVEELRQNGRQWLAGLQRTSGHFEKGEILEQDTTWQIIATGYRRFFVTPNGDLVRDH